MRSVTLPVAPPSKRARPAAAITVPPWLVTSQGGTVMAAAGLALLLGGATGNVTDRILHGAVTDFFEVWFGAYRYPAFNVADSAITIGAVLVLVDVLFGSKHDKPGRDSHLSPKG